MASITGQYGGKEWPGIDRCAGKFLDGIFQRSVIFSQGAFLILGTADELVARLPWTPEGANGRQPAVRSIGVLRSAQTGFMVITPCWFYVGEGGQRVTNLSTDYAIAAPVVYQG